MEERENIKAVIEQDYDRDEPCQGRWWKCEGCDSYFIMERGSWPNFCPYCGKAKE